MTTEAVPPPTLKELSDFLAAVKDDSRDGRGRYFSGMRMVKGTVTALTSATDWYARATVKLDANDTAIPDVAWVEGSTPHGISVNDRVWVVKFGEAYLILGIQHETGHPAPSVKVRRSTDQSIGNNAAQSSTNIDFSSATLDTDGMWDLAGDKTRLTCVRAGIYQASLSGLWDPVNTTGRRLFDIWKNNTDLIVRAELAPSSTITIFHNGSMPVLLAVGDYLQMKPFQTSGASLSAKSVVVGSEYHAPVMGAVWIGPPP